MLGLWFACVLEALKFELQNAQVHNRDLSIAVLRTFISKRKEEHEARLSRRTKSVQKLSEKDASGSGIEASDRLAVDNEKSNGECEDKVSDKDSLGSLVVEVSNEHAVDGEILNGECEVPEEIKEDKPCSISEEAMKTTERKVQRELEPPRVLEVLL